MCLRLKAQKTQPTFNFKVVKGYIGDFKLLNWDFRNNHLSQLHSTGSRV
jgi:hypothetical protein